MTPELIEVYERTLNRLAKWRSVFAGWQLGTRSKEDPECQAIRDHREASIILRVEMSAVSRLLLEKGVFTLEEFMEVQIKEAEELNKMLEKRFPGITSTDDGIEYDLPKAAQTMRGWRM